MPRQGSKTNRTSPQKDSNQKPPSKEGNRHTPPNNETTIGVYRSALTSLMSKGDQFGEVVRLAYSTEADQVVIDEDGLYLLQKYSTDTIGFLGFVGQDELSTNFFLDAGLNLCGCQGNQFTNVYGQQQTEGIYLWSLPLIPTPKLKIFLLVCTGLPSALQQLHRRHQILIDLTLLLSSSLTILNTPHIFASKTKRIFEQQSFQKFKGLDALPFMLKDLGAANQRIHKQCSSLRREDPFWPQTAFFLQPFRLSASVERQSQELFSRCHYYEMGSPLLHKEQTVQELLLSLNEQSPRVDLSFLESVGQFLLSLAGSCTVKEYEGLKMTGNLVCKLLINSVKYMAKKIVIKLDKIFTSIFKELYEASFIYHCQNYEQLLQQIFTEEDPISQDALLRALQSTADTVVASFNQQANNPHSQFYEQQLLQYIQEKERLLIDVNMRKNEHQIAVKIKYIQQQTTFEPQFIRKYIDCLKSIVVEHDHSSIELIVEKLLKYSNNLEQRIIDQKLKIEREQIGALKEQLRQKHKQYMKIKEVNEQVKRENQSREDAYKKSLKEMRSFQIKVRSIKKEIDAERKFQKEYMIKKQSKKEAAEKLLEQIREVEEKVRDNNRQMEDINKEYDYHPDILALNKRLEDREKQIRLLEKNQSRLFSNIQHSLVRSAIQKQPEGISQIQKSVIRQVSQKGAELTVPQRKTIKRLTTSKK